ncbi:hypothetical protein JCM14469_08600 [Desulfatiferula olefinivorans]
MEIGYTDGELFHVLGFTTEARRARSLDLFKVSRETTADFKNSWACRVRGGMGALVICDFESLWDNFGFTTEARS